MAVTRFKRFKKMGEKMVELSEPFNAAVSDMIGGETEMRKILAAWSSGDTRLPLAPLLVGNPGLGKTRIVHEMSRLCGRDLYVYQGHEDVTNEDLVCAVRFSDNPQKKMDYILRPLPTAMLSGCIFFLDGVAKMRKKSLALLESVLDERRYIESDLLGIRIHAAPGFRFIAASNLSDLDANPLPDYIQSRLRPVIHFSYPKREAINRILRSRYPELPADGKQILDLFWRLWRGRNNGNPPSPRDAIDVFKYALGLADVDKRGHASGDLAPRDKDTHTSFKEIHLEEAFDVLFTKETRSES